MWLQIWKTFRNGCANKLGEGELPPIQPVMVFTNEKATVNVEDAPVSVMQIKKLKDFVRKNSKDKTLTPEEVTRIEDILTSK